MPATSTPDFRAWIDELCRLARRTAALAEDDEIDAAKQVDQRARQRFAELLDAFPDAGERCLGLLAEEAPQAATPDVAPPDAAPQGTDAAPVGPEAHHVRRIVLQMVLQADLGRRHEVACSVDDRASVDALTHATLAAMPLGPVAAEVGDTALVDQPYLRLVHEPAVLDLLRLAGAGAFPRRVASRLLLTLWHNLEQFGERSGEELSRLALVLLDDQDPSRVVAACRQLLGDPRYRALVLAWLRERRDRELAVDVARLAAQELPPADALAALRELSPLLSHTRGVWLGLGIRAPGLLAEAYEEHLAADTQPDVRRELVMGVGMLPQPLGLELAELALANDPSVDVRMQAMFVFTVRGTPAAAERAIGRVLDDPAVAGDPARLGAVVLALQNLEQGDPNAVARLAARLATLPLAPEGRLQLQELLARCLPGGSLPAGGPKPEGPPGGGSSTGAGR